MKSTFPALAAFLLLTFSACDSGNKNTEKEETAVSAGEQPAEAAQTGIRLTDATPSPDFPDAMLEQSAPAEGAKLNAGKVKFEYNVKNFELTGMTEDAHEKMIANSHEGQHIHLILNNEPYDALYKPSHEKELKDGHYVELSFLSRSYHESIKHPDAYVLRQFVVGNAEDKQVDLNAPHLFYSRPKGTYTGQETEKVMLDFYIVNAELGENAYQVRATINGEEFMIDEWRPYYIEGLPMGESTIELELLDAEGKRVDSPLNPVSRTITLKEGDTQAAM
jgi:hypothetical protein